MRIAIVHYHLRRGGVTRVIETALEGLRQAGIEAEVVVLTGEMPDAGSPLADACRIVPELGYRKEACDADLLAADLERMASDALGSSPDVWHFHNHSLGKNVALPAVLNRLLENGARMLLQIHDFSEDGRPENFGRQLAAADPASTPWYPDAPQAHYAVLNRRDAEFLRQSGLTPNRLHLLPNAVAAPPIAEAFRPAFVKSGQRFLLYPTRGIRRKNLGELLLLAALTGDRCAFATTLAPENPEWLAIHDRWKAFGARHRLPVQLGIGAEPSVSFGGLIAAADAFVTTSVAEGFGLSFLEPWLAGKAIRGRNLPEITGDFTERGIALDGLYSRLEVPLDWVDAETYRAKIGKALTQSFRRYGRPLPHGAVERAFDSAVKNGRVDFGRLDEHLQEKVIESLIATPSRREEIDFPNLSPMSDIETKLNAEAIENAYGIPAYGERLADIYQKILNASPSATLTSLDQEQLLDAFLDPALFKLLQS